MWSSTAARQVQTALRMMQTGRRSCESLPPLRLGDIMVGWIKKVLLVLGIAFVVYYLFTRPEAAAEAIRAFFGAFESVVRFFSRLAG